MVLDNAYRIEWTDGRENVLFIQEIYLLSSKFSSTFKCNRWKILSDYNFTSIMQCVHCVHFNWYVSGDDDNRQPMKTNSKDIATMMRNSYVQTSDVCATKVRTWSINKMTIRIGTQTNWIAALKIAAIETFDNELSFVYIHNAGCLKSI